MAFSFKIGFLLEANTAEMFYCNTSFDSSFFYLGKIGQKKSAILECRYQLPALKFQG